MTVGELRWVFDDGGRKAAGYRGEAGDCACRSIAIATEQPYQRVYDTLNEWSKRERPKPGRRASSARNGVGMPTIRKYMESIGWTWVPTMHIGSGTNVHLRAAELPKGRLVVRVTKHITAVIDGVIHDNHDPSRDGARAVYGYFHK